MGLTVKNDGNQIQSYLEVWEISAGISMGCILGGWDDSRCKKTREGWRMSS
jgi:hypothetical protein